MPLLEADEIRALVDAAVDCDLARPERRDLLFGGLPRTVMAGIERVGIPSDQVECDLRALAEREAGAEGDGLAPLTIWLHNAERKAAGRPEGAVFGRVRALLPERKATRRAGLAAKYRAPKPLPADDDEMDRRLAARPILWVGAGLSMAAGYPSTDTLVEAIRAKASPADIPPQLTEFSAVVDAFVEAESAAGLHNILDGLFATPRKPTAVHEAIAALPGELALIVTTNYDTLIERALDAAEVRYRVVVLDANTHLSPDPETLVVAKIHGSREAWADVVLSGESYRAFGERYAWLTKQLDVWMTQHPIVFVGCSMRDPRVTEWLTGLPAARAALLHGWRPMMTRADWDAAWQAAPDALSVGSIRPLIVDDYGEHLPKLWSDAARRRAPRLDWLDLELTVDATGWSAQLGAARWRVERGIAGAGGDAGLLGEIERLRVEGNRPLPTDPHGAPRGMVAGIAAAVKRRAQTVGEQLTALLLSDAARAHVERAIEAATGDAPPCLRLRVRAATPGDVERADRVLALPWELLRLGGRFPVEAGVLDVAREAVVEGAEGPGAPCDPLTVVATVAAPIDASPLDYEDECYRLWTALGDEDRRLLLTDRGTVDELVDAVVEHRPPVVHFTGHGGPGSLLFEDEAARRHPVAVDALVERLRRAEGGALPRLMYLAACDGASVGGAAADEAGARAEAKGPKMTDPVAAEPAGRSVAASLNRAGFADVIGYFGPVGDAQSTRIEAVVYAALVAGKTAREAVRAGRAKAAKAIGPAGACTHVYPLGWAQLALYHRGADRAVATTRAARAVDIHRGRRRDERRLDKAGSSDDGVRHLRHGFIGRRSPRAEVIRRWLDGARWLVVHGLGGLGKTALCGEVAPILARRMGGVPILALDGTAARGVERPIEALWAELNAFAPAVEWDRDGWQATLAALQEGGLTGAGLARGILDAARRCGGLLVYLDDTESLLSEGGDRRAWVDDEARALWQMLGDTCAAGGPVGLLASSRYVPQHTPGEALVALPAMRAADVARMLRWMPTLGRLPHADAVWLAGKVDGHPRTVAWLDALAKLRGEEVARATIGPHARFAGDWRRAVIEPLLPEVEAEVDADLLLPQLYDALPAAARAHLGGCSVLTRAVPWGAVVALGDGESGAVLVEMGLLSPDVLAGEEAWWAPHGLVRDAVRARWDGDAEAAHGVVGRWLAAAFEAKPSTALLMPAIGHLLAAGEADAAWPLTLWLVLGLRGAGRFREALGPVEAVLAAGPTGEARGKALTFRVQLGNLAGVKLADPVADLEAAVALVGERDVGFVLDELGKLYKARGQLSAARDAFERSVKAVDAIEDERGLGFTLHELAGVLQAQGDLSGARETLERSLQIHTAVFGTEEHPSVAASMHALAGVLQTQGDLSGARETLERSLQIKAAVFGTEEHPSVAASLHALAGVLQARGDLSGARERLERSLQIKAAVFGTEEHPEVAASLHELAGVLQAQGDLSGAQARLERSLQIYAGVFSTDEHPNVAASLHSLAMVLWSQGHRMEAVARMRRVLAIEARLYGTRDHYVTAQTEHMLGEMLLAVGQRAEGVAMLTHALTVFRAVLGDGHPSTQDVAALLARLGGGRGAEAPTVHAAFARVQAGDMTGAIEMLEALVPAAVEAGDAVAEASARGLLGQLYAATGQAEAAREHLERAVEIAEQVGQANAAAAFREALAGLSG